MKLHYIVDRELAEKVDFPHYSLPIANDKVLMAVQWKDEVSEMQWCETPGVIPLPHPIFESQYVLSVEHLRHLMPLLHPHLRDNFELFAANAAYTIHHILARAAEVDPAFRCRVI